MPFGRDKVWTGLSLKGKLRLDKKNAGLAERQMRLASNQIEVGSTPTSRSIEKE
jgi:hypothetical protein